MMSIQQITLGGGQQIWGRRPLTPPKTPPRKTKESKREIYLGNVIEGVGSVWVTYLQVWNDY
jgi:hypothetical protein